MWEGEPIGKNSWRGTWWIYWLIAWLNTEVECQKAKRLLYRIAFADQQNIKNGENSLKAKYCVSLVKKSRTIYDIYINFEVNKKNTAQINVVFNPVAKLLKILVCSTTLLFWRERREETAEPTERTNRCLTSTANFSIDLRSPLADVEDKNKPEACLS